MNKRPAVRQPAVKGRSVRQKLSSPAVRTQSFAPPWLLHISLGLSLLALAAPAFGTTVKREAWGKISSGQAIDRYTLSSGDAEVCVVTYGARIVSVRVPDRAGKLANVVLGRDNLEGYYGGLGAVMGATIGRYANRIRGGSFTLDDTAWTLPKNNGPNTLHGGPEGFNLKPWEARKIRNGVAMTLVSSDGEMGFPGRLTLQVTFTLESKHGDALLAIDYRAITSRDTVLNVTNHSFFNLANDSGQSVLQDTAVIAADSYTPVDSTGIPTGAVSPVEGTPFDFRKERTIASALPPRGYDINLVLRSPGIDRLAAEVDDATSGRTLRVYTTEPALQLFVPHFPAPPAGSTTGPPRFPDVEGFCLETQHFPDSPNEPNFPTTTLKPGQVFQSKTLYVFGRNK